MKATNQLLAGVHIMAMAESMAFGRSQGISFERFMEVIPKMRGHQLDLGKSRTDNFIW